MQMNESNHRQCCYCDSWFHISYGYSYNGDPLCPKCYQRYFVACELCGAVMRRSESFVSEAGQALCYDCYCDLYDP